MEKRFCSMRCKYRGRWEGRIEMEEQKAAIEAILFAMGKSVELERIAAAISCDLQTTRELLQQMKEEYRQEKRGIQILELEGAYQMCTRKEMYEYLILIASVPKKQVLTDTLLETLSIVAYKQPVTKMDIEKIRGVKSDHAVNKLIEYHLICEAGRLDAPGRPILFATTEEFLRCFGVSSLEELPVVEVEQMEAFQIEAEEEVKEVKGVKEIKEVKEMEGLGE